MRTSSSPSARCDYLGQLVVAEVQVDQRVELGEAGQLLQLVAGQAQRFDVTQAGVSSFQDPQAVIGQIHVDQIVQVLQTQDSHFSATVDDKLHICRGGLRHLSECRECKSESTLTA